MRKLVVVCIIAVVGIIAWISYLKYDLNRFIKELPSTSDASSPSEQQVKGTAKDATETSVVGVTETEQTGLKSTLEGTPEDVAQLTQLINTNSNTKMERSGIETGQAKEDTRISPELEKFFTSYYNIRKEIEKVDKMELAPLQVQSLQMSNRWHAIVDQLSRDPDEATVKELNAELKEIEAWETMFNPKIYELQDEVRQIFGKQTVLLKEHGFLTWENFWNTHQKTYKAWVSEQFK